MSHKHLPDALAVLHNFDNTVVAPLRTAITAVIAYNGQVEGFFGLQQVRQCRPVLSGARAAILKNCCSGLLETAENELQRVIGPLER